MISFKTLRVFLSVARCGSFLAASEHVSLTAAGVGLQMKSLEDELGFAVFDRSGKSVTLNHRGHQFAKKAEAIIDLFEEAKYDQDARELAGSMRISSISTSMHLLVRAIIAMRRTHPNITIESGISYSGGLKRRVVEGEIDAALTVKSLHETMDDVLWTPLYKEPLAFIYSKRHHEGGEIGKILKKEIFFQSAINSNTGILVDDIMRRNHIRAHQTIQIDAVRVIIDLVRDGLGVTILPLSRGFDLGAYPDLEVRFFDGPHAYRTIGFIENPNRSFLTSALRSQLLGQLDQAAFPVPGPA
jgi:DNA-binding transcriptional LysR family regulator